MLLSLIIEFIYFIAFIDSIVFMASIDLIDLIAWIASIYLGTGFVRVLLLLQLSQFVRDRV